MNSVSDNRNIALFLADGCEEVEALATADVLKRAHLPVTMVSINETRTVVSSHNVTFEADTTISKINFDAYDMLILPGGMPGTPNLEANDILVSNVKRFVKEGRMVAAICAAPTILAHAGLLKDRRATCNPGRYEDLIRGDAILTREKVTVDGNIITSQAMGTAIPFALAIVEHFLGSEEAEKLAENIVY